MKKINLTLMFAFTVLFTQAQDFIQDFEDPNVTSQFGSSLTNVVNCPIENTNDNIFWIGDVTTCSSFVSTAPPDGGNFMLIEFGLNADNISDMFIYNQAVNISSGASTFSIDYTVPFAFNKTANTAGFIEIELWAFDPSGATLLTSITLPNGVPWSTFTSGVTIPSGIAAIALRQVDGFDIDREYAIDHIKLEQCNATIEYDFVNWNGELHTNFCDNEQMFLDASASSPVDQYYIELGREDLSTGIIEWNNWGDWIDGDLGLINLTAFSENVGLILVGEYIYHVRIVAIVCGSYEELAQSFSVCYSGGAFSCNPDNNTNSVNGPTAEFELNESIGATTTIQGLPEVNYMPMDGYINSWYIFTSNSINGPYTSFKKFITFGSFTLQNLNANKIYTVVHKVVGPCGEICFAKYLNTNGQIGTPTIDACNLADQYVTPSSGCNRVTELGGVDKEKKAELSKMIQNDLNNNYIKAQKAYIQHEKEIIRLLNSENTRINKLYVECKKTVRQLLGQTLLKGELNKIDKEQYTLFNLFLNELKGATVSKELGKTIEEVQKYLPVMLGKDALTAIKDFDQATEVKVNKIVNPALENISQTHLLNNLSNITTLQFHSANEEGSLLIQLYDVKGNHIQTIAKNVQLADGNFQANIDKSNLAQGIHLIEVQYTNQQGTYQETLKLPVFK